MTYKRRGSAQKRKRGYRDYVIIDLADSEIVIRGR